MEVALGEGEGREVIVTVSVMTIMAVDWEEVIILAVVLSIITVDGTKGSRVLVTLTVTAEVGEETVGVTTVVFSSTSPDPDSKAFIVPLLGSGRRRTRKRGRKKSLESRSEQ